jgi:Ras GTPase-activating-like protein IQGAP2/3
MIVTRTLKKSWVSKAVGMSPKALLTIQVELENGRQKAVLKIRENAQLEKILNDLDVKIALLVKNRISLEEVVHQAKKYKRKGEGDDKQGASLKSLDRESMNRLQSYQHLFYLLQAQPHYLAKLFFFMNQNASEKTKKLMEAVVLTLYGYAQNGREEYLLLKLLKVEFEWTFQ